MTRLFICGAMQIVFVSVYGTWAVLNPHSAFAWLVPFVVVVWVLVIYNNWRPIWAVLRRSGR